MAGTQQTSPGVLPFGSSHVNAMQRAVSAASYAREGVARRSVLALSPASNALASPRAVALSPARVASAAGRHAGRSRAGQEAAALMAAGLTASSFGVMDTVSFGLQHFDLGARLGVDVAAGVGAAAMLAPMITVLDKAITQTATGAIKSVGYGVREGVKDFLRNPLAYARRPEFRIIFGVYAATYVTANLVDSACDAADVSTRLGRDVSKLAVVTPTNMALCVMKDRALARMYGSSPAAALPLAAVLAFTGRDSMTIAASFTMPQRAAAALDDHAPGIVSTLGPGMTLAALQIALPCIVQPFATPLHLAGLDIYNRPGNTLASGAGAASAASRVERFKAALRSVAERVRHMRPQYKDQSLARMMRISWAFGVGGVNNRRMRQSMRARLGLDL
mmetsp:Transcript_94420/g.262224  ORF Transcript_94420/g.262224 Transcript_94420/m.262224 type:complete len:392 (+) Transcript_94420:178-1353(+)